MAVVISPSSVAVTTIERLRHGLGCPSCGLHRPHVIAAIGVLVEQPSDDGAEELPRRAATVVECGWHGVS